MTRERPVHREQSNQTPRRVRRRLGWFDTATRRIIGIGAVVGALLALAQGTGALARFVDHSLNHRDADTQLVSSLSAGVQLTVFTHALGDAQLMNQSRDYTERIFARPTFYVDVLTDRTDKVIFYSVTARRSTFRPLIRFFNRQYGCDARSERLCSGRSIHLVSSRFGDIDAREARYGLSAFCCVNRSGYVEAYGGDHAHNFITELVGVADTGVPSGADLAFSRVVSRYGGGFADGVLAPEHPDDVDGYRLLIPQDTPTSHAFKADWARMRRDMTINFYGEATPDFDASRFIVGADDSDHIAPLIYGPKAQDVSQLPS